MPAKTNLTKNADIDITVREVDFVTQFARRNEALREILGIMRPIKKAAGTKLTSKYATVTLNTTAVGEGEEIPYSKATVKEKEYATIAIEKYAKAVSIEAIDAKDYENAVQRTDEEFMNELEGAITDRFYTYLLTGMLTGTADTFQMALARAQGYVLDKFKKMRKGVSGVVGFCNILDLYDYYGAANITVQNQEGVFYVKNFMGYNTLILSSDIPRGKVIATPINNIAMYYVDPSDSSFARAGLVYTTDGETDLIGIHMQGNYGTAVSETFALMGVTLFAEYIDGISVITFDNSVKLDKHIANVGVGGTVTLTGTTSPASQTITWSTSNAAVATVSSGTVTGVKKGTAIITATITVSDVNYTDSCTITVG